MTLHTHKKPSRNSAAMAAAIIILLSLCVTLATIAQTSARDNGQWGDIDPKIREWITGLMQPDKPMISCCGKADAYWADDYTVRDGKVYAIITDDRDDIQLGRPHREIGSEWVVPDYKMKWDRGNPTGHGWLFLSGGGEVYCYVTPSGI